MAGKKQVKEKEEAQMVAGDFINFYKSGFLDGYKAGVRARSTKVDWNDLWKKCAKAYDNRFKLTKKIKKERKHAPKGK